MYFAKHETFHIRDGWLYKGLSMVAESPSVFLDQAAPEMFGLGNNMVRALRYWMQAAGLTEEIIRNRTKEQVHTTFGHLVYTNDPYLELDGTLWLIHYHLCSNPELATSWYWFFNLYAPVDFTREEFIARLEHWINLQSNNLTVSLSSLQKDFDCLTRTYLSSRRDKSPEDQIDSPLSTLGLLQASRDRDEESGKRIHRYHLNQPEITNIPSLVFLYILVKRQQQDRPDSSQVSLSQALREPANVGRTLNIGVRDLEEMLLRLEDEYPEWRVDLARAGGLDHLTLPSITADDILVRYYRDQQWA